jgi:predicted CopG family antitoxin
MIKDEVYMKLRRIKGKRSFSETLDDLSNRYEASDKEPFRRMVGMLNHKESEELREKVKKIREQFKVRKYEDIA